MNFTKHGIFSFLLPVLLLFCCSPVIFAPLETDLQRARNQWSEITLEQLQMGYKLYINKCGGCHNLYPLHQFPKEKWIKLMPDMAKEAKLDSAKIGLIARYILTMQEVKMRDK